MHILLIEDQVKLATNIRKYLESERYAVTIAHDGREGLEKAMTLGIDLVILDVNLPSLDGFNLCSILREKGNSVPILMLTARAKQDEVIRGLNIGADDYLKKPFDLDELLARVRVLLRRKTQTREPMLSIGDMTLDTNAREVTVKKNRIDLSPKEFGLLEFLLRNKDIVQDRPTILEHVWGNNDSLMLSQTVDVHVATLRKKIGKDMIRTVPGKGYLIPSR